MFDFDLSKILVVGAIALLVVGPKDFPRVLRTLGQVIGKVRRIADGARSQFTDMLDEADLDGAKAEIKSIARSTHLDIATDPKTAMRGSLPEAPRSPTKAMSTTDPQPERLEPTYSSPEMRSYLTPAPCDETVATPARSTVEAADENET